MADNDGSKEDQNRVLESGYSPSQDAIQRGYEKKFDAAGDLSRREAQTGANSGSQPEGSGGGSADTATKDIDNARTKEGSGGNGGGGGGWNTRITGPAPGGGGKKGFGATLKGLARRKGPMGLLLGLLAGFGFGIGAFLPGGALIHFKEVIVEKFDSMTAVTEERAMVAFAKRLNATNASCKIKVKCRYKGLRPSELGRLRLQGAEILDKNGKPITCKNKKCVGGFTMVLPNGQKVKASQFKRELTRNRVLYGIAKESFPRFSGWNTKKAALKIRQKFKLISDPKWGKAGDEKSTRQAIYRAVSGEASSAPSEVVMSDSDKYEVDEDGKPLEDADGNKIPKGTDVNEHGQFVDEDGKVIKGSNGQALQPTPGTNIDFGNSADDINEEARRLQGRAAAGEPIDPIPSDPAGAASMDEFEGSGGSLAKKGFQKALSFLNPAGFLAGVCTTYQLTNAIVLIAQGIGLVNDMRYASQFIATADKFKYGDGSAFEMEQAMTILQRLNMFGFAWGDSLAYQYAVYDFIPAMGAAASAAGNATIQVMETALNYINDHVPGGKTAVHAVCAIATNTAVQVGLSLTSFIPGAGQVTNGIKTLFTAGGKRAAEEAIKRQVKNIVEAAAKKKADGELKSTAVAATKKFVSMAKTPLGMFMAGYILSKYGVPYIARQISSTMLTGNEDGVLAADTIGNGFDATNAATASETGLKPLTKAEDATYRKFEEKSKERYMAYRRETSNPFDIYDPYSVSNSFAAALYSFSSNFNSPADILSIPASILSNLNPTGILAKTALADTDKDHYCKAVRVYDQNNLASTPFCNARYGLGHLDLDPEATVDWLYANKQIDAEGEPVPESDYAKFSQKCMEDSGGKRVTDIGEDDTRLDKECYKDTSPKVTVGGETLSKHTLYRIYRVDTITSEDPIEDTDADTTGFYDTTTPAKELAQIGNTQ